MKRVFLILGIVVAAAVIGLIVYSAMTEDALEVTTRKIERKKIVQTVQATGKVEPVEKVEISAYVSAEITRLPVKEGDHVKKGDLLVALDSTRYAASRDQFAAMQSAAKAQVEQMRASLDQSRRTYKRTEQLAAQDLVSSEELERARTAVEVQEAQLAAARDQVRQAAANLRVAGDELSKSVLRSPIDGMIIALNKKVGEIVLGSQFTRDIIMTVADMSAMETVVEVDENDVPNVSLGQEARIEIDALPAREFTGKVVEIATSAKVAMLGTQEETTNFDVTIRLDEGEGFADIRPGMSATANIVTDTEEDALAAPIQCVTMRDPDAPEDKPLSQIRASDLEDVVFRVSEQRAKVLPVKTGISSEFDIVLTGAGIAEGDELICGPYKTLNRELKNNDLVEIQEEQDEDEEG
ncbi:efflux RND transporter periplasmic adaptor subunit [bacterium]|nr:efflux RND transporter periplasmic adaptor subunit [bacterium]